MAYLLGNLTCIESLQNDIQDLQWAATELISRVGPAQIQSWKFPDKLACDLDITDLLDLYSCDEQDDMEEKQVAHIALYELVIDRLILLLQMTSAFIEQNLNEKKQNEDKKLCSAGLVAKEYWHHLVRFSAAFQQLQSENRSNSQKLAEFEKEGNITCPNNQPSLTYKSHYHPDTPGTLGVIPPNNADLVLLGLASPPAKHFSISQDTNHKSCQTLETAFVPCESCDIVQRKMRESGDQVIKSCVDQGLPCSLKKFKAQVSHVELLTFNDICRWMTEQNKDISRIVKQSELLQSLVDPLKKEVKEAGAKVKEVDKKLAENEERILEVKEQNKVVCRNLENKLKEQEKKHIEQLSVERQVKEKLLQQKEAVDKNLSDAKQQIDEQLAAMNKLEMDLKILEHELEAKVQEAERANGLTEEIVQLKSQLSDVTAQMIGYQKSLAKEQSKCRSLSKHNESLQSKQEALLSRMDLLGQNNETVSAQLVAIEEERSSLDNKLLELTVEAKELRKQLKENEVIIKNLEKDKKSLEKSLRDSLAASDDLKALLEEAKEREKMMVEYPDLNGPVNRDYQGTGDIASDMKNQITANQIRIRLLEHQNENLSESVKRIGVLQKQSSLDKGGDSQKEHNLSQAFRPQPLWQLDSSRSNINNSNNVTQKVSNREFSNNRNYSNHQPLPKSSSRKEMPNVNRFAWEESSSHTRNDISASEFLIGHGLADSRQNHHGPDSSLKDKPHTLSMRPPSAKVHSIMAPVNATPIAAYTQMKKSLGALQGREASKKVRPVSAVGGNILIQDFSQDDQPSRNTVDLPFSCPRCDKMYSHARDLKIHQTYCT